MLAIRKKLYLFSIIIICSLYLRVKILTLVIQSRHFFLSCVLRMLNLFSRYVSVGVLNTALHWVIFIALVYFLDSSQAMANFIAFCFAVTFSFFANSKWTFQARATLSRYLIFVIFMGFIAVALGWIADTLDLPGLITLVSFSIVSLFLGFIYSRYIVFRESK